jgi:hypothetical protein
LRRRKAASGFGIPALEWPDIDAFLRHSGVSLSPWEIAVVEAIDDAFISVRNERK